MIFPSSLLQIAALSCSKLVILREAVRTQLVDCLSTDWLQVVDFCVFTFKDRSILFSGFGGSLLYEPVSHESVAEACIHKLL